VPRLRLLPHELEVGDVYHDAAGTWWMVNQAPVTDPPGGNGRGHRVVVTVIGATGPPVEHAFAAHERIPVTRAVERD